MSIATLMARQCTQTCVYWGNPREDGEGGHIFDDPVELKCRWEDIQQVVRDTQGNMVTSRAVVYLLQDVDEQGMLYLGTLDDIDSADYDNPKNVDGAFYIMRFSKTPNLGSTSDFLRVVFLTVSLSFGGF